MYLNCGENEPREILAKLVPRRYKLTLLLPGWNEVVGL
jgi:hypothetical protein